MFEFFKILFCLFSILTLTFVHLLILLFKFLIIFFKRRSLLRFFIRFWARNFIVVRSGIVELVWLLWVKWSSVTFLSLLVPIHVEHVFVFCYFRCVLIYQLEISFGLDSCYGKFRIEIVLYLNPLEPVSFHKGNDQSEVEAPDHDDNKDYHENQQLIFIINFFACIHNFLLFHIFIKLIHPNNWTCKYAKIHSLNKNALQKLVRHDFTTFDVEQVVRSTVFAVYLMIHQAKSCRTVWMSIFLMAGALLDDFWIDS